MTSVPSGFQHAASYLNIHLTHAGPGVHAHSLGPFVTLSRESGLGGNAFAEMLAPRLPPGNEHPWSVYSANLIDEMLRTNRLPAHLARFLPEDRVSEFNATIGEVVGLHPNLWMLVSKTNEMIRRIARGGHAILLGRGANIADPTAYDYVINIERVPLEAAIEIIVDAVARISPPAATIAAHG